MKKATILVLVLVTLFSCKKTEDINVIQDAQSLKVLANLGIEISSLDTAKVINLSSKEAKYHLNFKNMEDAKVFFSSLKMKHQTGSMQLLNAPEMGDNINADFDAYAEQIKKLMAVLKQGAGLFADFNIRFNYSINGSSYTASFDKAYYSGLAPGIEYHNNSFESHITNGTIYFTMYGYDTYSMFIDGGGTYFTSHQEIHGSYNPNTNTGTFEKSYDPHPERHQ